MIEKSYDKKGNLKNRLKKEVQITDLFQAIGIDIDYHSKKWPCVQAHDSWVIDTKKNVSHWNSQHKIGGDLYNSYIWAVEAFQGRTIDFVTAFQEIKGFVQQGKIQKVKKQDVSNQKPKETLQSQHDRLHFGKFNELTEKNEKAEEARQYLCKERCISPSVFDHFKNQRWLEQSRARFNYENDSVIFPAKNEKGLVAAIMEREISSDKKAFKGDYDNCDYTFGWFYDLEVDTLNMSNDLYNHSFQGPNPNKPLIVFESVIEVMSYMSLLEKAGVDPRSYAYLATGGVNKMECVSNVCSAVGYQSVIISFNNDLKAELNHRLNGGKSAAVSLQEILESKNIDTQIMLPAYCNDWNDTLKMVVKGVEKDTILNDGSKIQGNYRLSIEDSLNYCDELPAKEQMEKREVWMGPIPSEYTNSKENIKSRIDGPIL